MKNSVQPLLRECALLVLRGAQRLRRYGNNLPVLSLCEHPAVRSSAVVLCDALFFFICKFPKNAVESPASAAQKLMQVFKTRDHVGGSSLRNLRAATINCL